MTARLAVLLGGRRIGTLHQDHRTEFQYDPEYLDQRSPTPLSLSMPPRSDRWRQAQTLPWLDGLLPDRADVRRRWATHFGVSARNPFALVGRMGLDLPGAVQICPESDVAHAANLRGSLRPVTEKDIGARLAALRADEESWTVAGERWSLGGAQAKFALAAHNGEWFEALGAEPTTHIIKPGVAGYAAQGLVEHVCMTAASRLGLGVASTRYVEFDGQPAIVASRYDRVTRDGQTIRVHQEDLCQALSYPSAKKYETDGGPDAATISDLLRGRADESSAWRFVESVAFNYLIGSSDAHAKNYSVLLAGTQARLAPLYDLASSLPYDPLEDNSDLRKVAMAIGGQRHYGRVTRRDWERFARRTGVDPDHLRKRVEQLAAGLLDAVEAALDTVPGGSGVAALRDRLLQRLRDHLAVVRLGLDR